MERVDLDMLWLHACCFYEPKAVARLLESFGDAQTALRHESEWEKIVPRRALWKPGFSRKELLEAIKQEKLTALLLSDDRYPELLKQIPDPPSLIYVKGVLSVLKAQSIAIVGTRRPTPYGKEVASKLAEELARAGLAVVSGGARGIDTAAHQGALKTGKTIAVLGTGLNVPYPRENKKLFEQIAENGCLVSEFPPFLGPLAHHFPMRNRIISGLSLGVIVVEAREKSGALITARLAGEHGREVFAVPGKITNPCSVGPHKLLQDGAKLVSDVQDVLEEFGFQFKKVPVELPPLNAKERDVLHLIPEDCIDMETILQKSSFPYAEALALLTSLEMKGYIQKIAGQKIVRCLPG